MITKELIKNKSCLFCASDYHLEMILLPYIKQRINNSKFVVFTQDDLEDTLKKVLNSTNIEDKLKEKIININWKRKESVKDFIKDERNTIVIINGDYNYIQSINNKILDRNIEIIDCFHIDDLNVDVSVLYKKYSNVLNTMKI